MEKRDARKISVELNTNSDVVVCGCFGEEYPGIALKAHEEGAEILWGDETECSSEDNRGRGYATKGQTPIVYGPGKRFSASMISAINNQANRSSWFTKVR